MRIVSILTIGLIALPVSSAEPDLKPAETYAVIAGVLQWPGNRISGFPTKNRKDEELHDTLKARGVPADNMKLLLDEEATYSGIKRAIKTIAAKATAGSTLIFYYCGHGIANGKGGELCLANYDLIPQRPALTGLLASDLAAMIQKEFHGKRVLFLADCCFSGGLAPAAAALHKAGFETAIVTSSNEQVVSTLNWTFTQTIIDAFKGDTFADANADGIVTLNELNAEVKAAMGALERQPSGFVTHGWNGDFKLATTKVPVAAKETAFKTGQFVIVSGVPRAGRVVSGTEGKYAVQFYDYTEKVRVEVPEAKLQALPKGWEDRTKKFDAALKPETAEIEVEWNGQWFPATVLKKDGEKTQIHYVGYGPEFDEWVTKNRIRPLKK